MSWHHRIWGKSLQSKAFPWVTPVHTAHVTPQPAGNETTPDLLFVMDLLSPLQLGSLPWKGDICWQDSASLDLLLLPVPLGAQKAWCSWALCLAPVWRDKFVAEQGKAGREKNNGRGQRHSCYTPAGSRDVDIAPWGKSTHVIFTSLDKATHMRYQ